MKVTDNRRGFHLEPAKRRTPGRGPLGLLGMEERVKQFGGVLTATSAAGEGTTIVARLEDRP